MGGTGSLRHIVSATGLPYPTVRDGLMRLLAAERLRRERGLYTLLDPVGGDREALRLLGAIEESGLDAHLTGLDLLVHWWQQFSYRTPHLVYADPASFDPIVRVLTDHGFVVIPVDRSHRQQTAETPESTGIVYLRRQSADYSARFGVIGGRASVEKAWLDSVRESRRGLVPASLYDLGQILGAALANKAVDLGRLKSLARQAKLSFVVAALEGEPDSREAQDLRAGIDSERGMSGE
jgi:hypothetical protein